MRNQYERERERKKERKGRRIMNYQKENRRGKKEAVIFIAKEINRY